MSEDDGSDGRLFLAGFTPTQTPPVPGWFAVFVRLMVDGTGEDDRLRGVVHARIDDDGGTEFEYRIARRGGLSLDRLASAVRAGESRALLVRGEAGIGKAALREYMFDRAADCRMAQASGVQAEQETAFAALLQV